MRLPIQIALGALAVFGAMQLVRFDRTNPPVTADVPAPPDVRNVLRRSCYDCHSNETVWPWYSAIAPVSWLLHHDVTGGRETLNFSSWGMQAPAGKAEQRREIRDSVAEGEMPLWYYLPMHPSARLSDADKKVLEDWAETSTE
jgi:cytochrome c551/c552